MTSKWNEGKLTVYAYNWLITEYGIELKIPIRVSNRLKATFGKFRIRNTKPLEIQISNEMLNYHSDEVILDVLKHELIHYVCYITGKQYKDGSNDFEEELSRQGVASTRTYQFKGKVHEYTCTCCNNIIRRNRRFNTENYRCAIGKGKFVYKGETVMA